MNKTTPKFLSFILFLLLISGLTEAQNDSFPNTSTIWSKVEAFTPTTIVLPDNYDPDKTHTLVIGLHGFGSTAESFLELSKPFTDAGFIYAVPEAPYPVLRRDGNLGYEWFLYDISSYIMLERPASALEIAAMRVTTERQMAQVIKDIREQYRVGDIYLAGMSQGGIITYLSGIHHHDKISGMVIFGSVVDEDWLGSDDIQAGKDVRTLIIQGESDKAVPHEFAEAARDLLNKNGYDVTYKTFDGGHEVPMHLMDYVIAWINE